MGDCETGPFPSFSRRGGCAINKKIPFLSGADGVVRKFQQNEVRYADIDKEAARSFTNHPVCAAEERDLFIEAQPPLLEKERNGLASTAVIDFESPRLTQSREIRRLT